MVENIDLVVVKSHHDFKIRVVIQVADAYIQAVTTIAMVPWSVCIGIISRSGFSVVPRPGIITQFGRLVQTPVWVERKDLSPAIGLSGASDDFDEAVSVKIPASDPPHFRALAGITGACRPTRLDRQRVVAPLVGCYLTVAAGNNDLENTVAI